MRWATTRKPGGSFRFDGDRIRSLREFEFGPGLIDSRGLPMDLITVGKSSHSRTRPQSFLPFLLQLRWA